MQTTQMVFYYQPDKQGEKKKKQLKSLNFCGPCSALVYSRNKLPRFAKLHLISGGL